MAVAKHAEFKGTVITGDTRPFQRSVEESPSGFGYHWNQIGGSMGKATLDLLGR